MATGTQLAKSTLWLSKGWECDDVRGKNHHWYFEGGKRISPTKNQLTNKHMDS
jgi:hypothetical protein